MSISEDLAAVVTAANSLTQTVTDKISSIDQRVTQFQTDALNITNQVTTQLKRAKIGHNQFPQVAIRPTPQDDTGLLVQAAFDAGNKFVGVDWDNDGQDRHWNTMVNIPAGGTIYIAGPKCDRTTISGDVRTDRACFARGANLGTSVDGSPMIFRNLSPGGVDYPHNAYSKVYDETCLIQLNGNNLVLFGNGTYLFDQAGTLPNPYGNALVRVSSYIYDMPCWIGGGGYNCQFYMSGPLVNNDLACSKVDILFMHGSFIKLDSDGPALNVDKGFKRLLDKGVAGVTSSLLTKQPWEVTEIEAGYNDVDYAGANYNWYVYSRGIDTEANNPRFVSLLTWSHGGGITTVQLIGGSGEMSMAGLAQVAGKEYYLGTTYS